jgi:hypothetical protein
MNLTCMVRDSPEPPQFIFWKHNDQVRRRRRGGSDQKPPGHLLRLPARGRQPDYREGRDDRLVPPDPARPGGRLWLLPVPAERGWTRWGHGPRHQRWAAHALQPHPHP